MNYKCMMTSLGLLLLWTACSSDGKQQTRVRSVQTYEVKSNTETSLNTFPGKVKASDEADLAFRIPGQITSIQAKPGRLIRKGEVLATLDSRDYLTQLAATEAEYQTVKAQADRIARLYDRQSVSTNDYDKAMGGLKQITEKLTAHRNAVKDTRLLAPYDGYIREPLHRVGETVGAGMPVLSIYASSVPEVEINISASDYLKRASFQAFTCTVDAIGETIYPLELISISPVPNSSQLYAVRLRFTQKDNLPALGMSSMVSIQLRDENNNFCLIPVSAIWEKEQIPHVWIVQADETIKAVPVNVHEVKRDGNAVCSGLEAGSTIISAGTSTLREAEKVRPIAPTSSTNVGGLL